MRLFLSSHDLGGHAGALLALLGNGKRAAIIVNARDFRGGLDNGPRCASREALAALGIDSFTLDLRQYFGDHRGLRSRLRGFDLVWVLGGNSFILRRAMKQSGFDDLIVEMLDSDQIVYGGFAAGAIVATPSLRFMEEMDDPAEIPRGYDPSVIWEGLGLIDHAVVPHYRSPHPASVAAERVVRRLSMAGMRYRALRDGEVIVWRETRMRNVDPLRIA